MAKRMTSAMAIAIGRCHEQNKAHSTPLQTTTRVAQFCGVSNYDQIQSDGDLGTLAARLGLEIEQ